MNARLWFCLIGGGLLCSAQAQVLLLQNPSFEDEPGFGRTPQGWFYCGDFGETPPDVHPFGLFGVTHQAKQGNTYMGMVVRDNHTWEGLSQWLPTPLQAGQCYAWAVYAARSTTYQSISRTTMQLTDFVAPVVLRVWGGYLNCERRELLAVSPLIESSNWQRYVLHFQPHEAYSRVIMEAYYADATTPYCGNVLLDHLSPLLPVDCATGQATVPLDTLYLPPRLSDSLLAAAAHLISFSAVDQQVEQQAFYLPSGEWLQANRALYVLAQLLPARPQRKLKIQLYEPNRQFFKIKAESLQRELSRHGLDQRQFRIQKYRQKKEAVVPLGVVIEME